VALSSLLQSNYPGGPIALKTLIINNITEYMLIAYGYYWTKGLDYPVITPVSAQLKNKWGKI